MKSRGRPFAKGNKGGPGRPRKKPEEPKDEEKPGIVKRTLKRAVDTVVASVGGDPRDIRARYSNGPEFLATAHDVADDLLRGITELELPDLTARQARRILAERNRIQHAMVPEVKALHDGEEVSVRRMSWNEFTEQYGGEHGQNPHLGFPSLRRR